MGFGTGSRVQILKFDAVHGRTCLHYAAYYGHSDCLQAILLAAQSSTVADSWGFAHFINVSDGSGATPLHLAARQGQATFVHILLDNGALVCALTARYGCLGSSPLHLAARRGSLDCCLILELPFYLEGKGGLFDFIEKRLKENGHMVLVVAEGAGQELIAETMRSMDHEDASGNKLLLDVGLWLT